MQTWFDELKGQFRCECGEDRIPCLDFHHESGEKEINISHAIKRGWSKKRILAEIAKCKVLCSNCHRYLHWVERRSCRAKENQVQDGMLF